MLWKAKIEVTIKKGILDPQGAAVESSLTVLNFCGVHRVRVGKYIELILEGASREEAADQVEEMCRRLLTNPVIEDYTYALVEG